MKSHYWRLAWVAFVLAIPLRLYFFAGWGLGDDPQFASSAISMLGGHFAYQDSLLYRVGVMLPVVLGFKLFGVSEFVFVLPIFLYALGAHVISLYLSRDVLGERAAFLCSLIFLLTPFETLTSTSFSPDYSLGFCGVLTVWSVYRGLRDSRLSWMWIGGAAFALAILCKVSIMYVLPIIALAACTDPRRWRLWLPVFAPSLLVMSAVALASSYYLGSPLAWMQYAAWFPGWPMKTWSDLWLTWKLYPSYLLWITRVNSSHSLMFGLTGWVALGGICLASWSFLRRKQLWASSIVLCMFAYFLIFNFAPHSLSLSGYYSHPRIFRYLSTVSPFVYFAVAFFFEMLLRTQSKVVQRTGVLMLSSTLLVNMSSISRVSEPSWDPNREARMLTSFLSEHIPSGSLIQADYFICHRIRDMLHPSASQWSLDPVALTSKKAKEDYFKSRTRGYVITGGGTLAWYTYGEWVLNLSDTAFRPGRRWKLIYESPITKRASWRKEPFRVWQIRGASTDEPTTAVALADSEVARSIAAGVSNRVVYVDGYHAVIPPDLVESHGKSDGVFGKLGFRKAEVFAAVGAEATAYANQGFVYNRDELFKSGLLVMMYGIGQLKPDAEEYAVVRQYIANGGRLLLMCPAWVWVGYDRKPLSDLPYDIIAREFGLAMETTYVRVPLKVVHPKWDFGGIEKEIEGVFSAITCNSTNATPILVGSDGKVAAVAATKGNARVVLWAQDNLLRAKTTDNPNVRKAITQMVNWLLE